MSGLAELDELEAAVERKRWFGAYPAQVTDLNDPDSQGRVKVRLPWAPDDTGYEVWARVAVLMGGSSRGTWFIPDKDDEVLVVFEGGDPRRPYVIGGLWNGTDTPPESMDSSGKNYLKSIVSRNDIRIILDDHDGQEKLTLKTPQQTIVIDDGGRSVEITDANGNTFTMDSSGVAIVASAQVSIKAGTVEINSGQVTVNAGMSKFSGVVQADTVISNSIVGSSYTPGAGNIW